MLLIEILPNLYLGDNESVKYKEQLNISAVINCGYDLKNIGTHTNYVFNIKKNLEKYELVKMYQYLNESVNFIYKNIIQDNPVLVFCENGNQKSASIIAAYIIKYGKMSIDDAIKTIRTKNKTAFYPNIDFYTSLQMIDNGNL